MTFSWIRATIFPSASTNWVSYLGIHLLEFVLCFTSVKITVAFAASTTLQFSDSLRVAKSLYWHVLGTQYCAPMTGPPILSEGLAILLSYNQGLVWSLRGRLCALLECTLCLECTEEKAGLSVGEPVSKREGWSSLWKVRTIRSCNSLVYGSSSLEMKF